MTYWHNIPVIDDGTDWPLGSRGLIPRNYSQQPLGSLPYAAPLDIPLIPRSEWGDRIRQKEKDGATLRELCRSSGLNPPDQNGTNYCHVQDTEVLTEAGWKFWEDYNWLDRLATVDPCTGQLEYQPVIQKHIYDYQGPIYYVENSRLNFGVTPEHKFLARPWIPKDEKFSRHLDFLALDRQLVPLALPEAPLTWNGARIHDLEIPGSGHYQGDDFVILLALLCSEDGGLDAAGDELFFSRRSSHPFETLLRSLAQRLNFQEDSDGQRWVKRQDSALNAWVSSHVYSSRSSAHRQKRVPPLVQQLSVDQIQLFLNFFEPQVRLSQSIFASHDRLLLDDLQELLLRLGRRSQIEDEPSGCAHPVFGMRKLLRVEPYEQLVLDPARDILVDHYSGPVYCAGVPNRTLITRRRGKILISGNCWANGPTHALEICRLIQGQKLVRLSPASVAAPLTGFRNVGGWGAKALDYIVKHGVCPVSLWPPNAISRKYDTEASRAERQKYRVTHWYDVVTTQNMSARERFERLATMLLLGYPCSVAYNWWGHLVCAVDLVLLNDGKFGVFCHNSGAGRDAQGFTVLSESRGAPDECLAPHIAAVSSD